MLLTDTHLIILRHAPERGEGKAYVHSRRPLQNVIKITSKRKLPELIGFQYGRYRVLAAGDREPDGGSELIIEGSDRLLIPKAGDAVRFVKQAVVRLTETAPSAAVAAVAAPATSEAAVSSSLSPSPTLPASPELTSPVVSSDTSTAANGDTPSQLAADSSQNAIQVPLSVSTPDSRTPAAVSATADTNSSSA